MLPLYSVKIISGETVWQLNTLKKNKEFGLVYNRGKSFASKNLVIICLKRKYGPVRVGFSVSKKVGGSVLRNKIRRRLKECMRCYYSEISGSFHIIFVARRPIAVAAYSQIKDEMGYLLKKAGLL